MNTMLLQPIPPNIKALEARSHSVNSIAQMAWKTLSKSPDYVIAYAIGFGNMSIEDIYFYCRENLKVLTYQGVEIKCSEEGRSTQAINRAEHANIFMNERRDSYSENLSRFLPNPIENAEMICLPKKTNGIYEKEGTTNLVPSAVYYCENAMVIVDSRRKQNGTTIVYDLVYVNDGSIVGSNELINRFIIFGGRVSITGGDNTTNEFILTKPDFLGKINPGQNSTNVFDFHYIKNSALEENILKININYQQSRSATQRSQNVLEIKMNSHSLTIMESVNDNFEFSEYSYIGREEEVDEFSCTGDLYHNFVVNSGGAYFGSRDIIENCSKVIIGSNVDVIGGEGNYTFYIEAAEYLYGNSYSRIDVKGTGTIIFTGISLLDDSISITYFPKVNTLHIERRDDGRGNSYSLGIKNYIEQSSNKPNFVLINKDGNNVVPEIKKTGITRIDSSKLYEEYSLNDFSAVKRHYHTNILNSKESYKVIEIIKNEANNSTIVFGSSGNDIIILDKETVFVEGGNGNDMYVINNDTEEKSITIDNHSDDKKLDTILMQEALGEFGMQGCDLYLNPNIRVKNYLQGDSYKHFIVMNKKGETFIPYVESMLYESELYANSSMEYGKLVPFFHATQTQNMFLLPEDFQDDHVVINSRLEDIERYKDKDDLLLIRESGIPFIIRIENFYNDRNKWIGINFLLWNNGNFSYFDLPQEIDEAVSYQDKLKDDYEEVIKEYVIDFTGSVNITHNQDDTLTSVGQRVGVVIL
ncbi:hypothetical protein, partial [Wolbachia endosymbiont of Cylisticus convexus]|uniref:hypothetical protein n=1 Tax=Wolbachia endosymbiont of Cylisticus convexus TaxID=118728 RepID=UPI0011C0295F